jgi:hypothetical protein
MMAMWCWSITVPAGGVDPPALAINLAQSYREIDDKVVE